MDKHMMAQLFWHLYEDAMSKGDLPAATVWAWRYNRWAFKPELPTPFERAAICAAAHHTDDVAGRGWPPKFVVRDGLRFVLKRRKPDHLTRKIDV
jgi:hypothetical protein